MLDDTSALMLVRQSTEVALQPRAATRGGRPKQHRDLPISGSTERFCVPKTKPRRFVWQKLGVAGAAPDHAPPDRRSRRRVALPGLPTSRYEQRLGRARGDLALCPGQQQSKRSRTTSRMRL